MKLYELSAQYNELAEMLEIAENNDNADIEVIKDTLDAIKEEFDTKIESIAKMIKSKEAEKEAVLNESKRLKERADKITKSIDFLKGYIKQEMKNIGKDKVESTLFNIKLAWNPPKVNIHDESKIPQEYIVVKETKSIDKRAILNDLKNGKEIQGVEITQEKGLRIK